MRPFGTIPYYCVPILNITDHVGPYRKIQNPRGPNKYKWTIGHHMLAWKNKYGLQCHTKPCRAIKDLTGPYWTTQDHMGPYGTIRDHAGPYRTIQDHIWDYTEPYRTIRDHTGPNRAIPNPTTIPDLTGPCRTKRDRKGQENYFFLGKKIEWYPSLEESIRGFFFVR